MRSFDLRDLRQYRAIDLSIRSSVFRYVRICESVFPFCQLPIFICPSRPISALPSIRPSGPSVHLSTSTRPYRVTYRSACTRACILIQSIRQSIPLIPASLLSSSFLLFLSHFIYLFIHLPFRSRSPSSASRSHLDLTRRAASIDLSRARSILSQFSRGRESRESPGDSPRRDSLARTSRVGDSRAAAARRRWDREAAAGPLPGEADSPRRWTPRCCARLLA